ncbi:MAG: hypothetical protein KC657_16700 [Myxococcales bacterium]|nr:hypothetical protein [Myxococcales bacterium]
MHAKREKARARKWKRRIKAVASIGVALAAGTFLACQRGAETVKREVIDVRARLGGEDASVRYDAADDATTDGDVGTELDAAGDATADAGARRKGSKDASVDVKEHRKGMPVRDNLLE